MHSKLLSVLFMALVLVVACAAMPGAIGGETITGQPITGQPISGELITIIPNTTNIPRRMSTYSMGCKTNGNTKVYVSDADGFYISAMDWDTVHNHFRSHTPDWKKYTSYEFCFYGSWCGAMTTLTGSEFYPKNYEHVANKAVDEFYKTEVCQLRGVKGMEGVRLYPRALDTYFYDLNFVFSWWEIDAIFWKCQYLNTNRSE